MSAPLEALRREGFAVIHDVAAEAFELIVAELGDVVVRTSVELRQDVPTYLCQPDAIPMHTDHPDIAVVAWWCERQDDRDGATLLVDTRDVLARLDDETQEQLRHVGLPCPDLRGTTSTKTSRSRALLSSGAAVYFAEWLEPSDAAALRTWRHFADAIASAPRRRVRLEPGDVLLLDNRRVLHGRGPLHPSSGRRLRRAWVVASARGKA